MITGIRTRLRLITHYNNACQRFVLDRFGFLYSRPVGLFPNNRRYQKWTMDNLHSNKKVIRITQAPGTDEYSMLLNKVKKALQRNIIIAVPTDTVYGLGCLAQSTEAVTEMYALKGRSKTKPVAICLSDTSDIRKWAIIPRELPTGLLEELLPGPVTVVLQRTEVLNSHLNPGVGTVGIRIPDHQFLRDLVASLLEPLALTSANRSNAKSCLDVGEFADIWDSLGIILDDGCLVDMETKQSRLGSSVVDLAWPPFYHIIRYGVDYLAVQNILEGYGLVEGRPRKQGMSGKSELSGAGDCAIGTEIQ